MRARALLALLVVALTVDRALALTLLTHGKVAVVRDRPGTERDAARFRFGPDPALATLVDPTCAGGNASTVRVAAYPVATSRLEAQPLATLSCGLWRRASDGFVYENDTGSEGGVRRIEYGSRRLVVRIEGGSYRHVPGPVGYVEVWLGLGGERLLGRFHEFRANGPTAIVSRRPSAAAAAGEAGFWDVLWGDDASETRQQGTLATLRRAARRDRADGRSRFLLGMMHLYRFGQATPDYRLASPGARADIDAAEAALAAAARRLWDGRRGDTRVPGFAAAAKYVQAVVHGDVAREQEALADLEAAITINPIFNLFDLIGVVPPVITPTDPLYARVLEVMDFALNGQNATCVASQPEICGNAGMAPHNIEGALLLFGDLYAKGGVVDDPYPFRGARNLYVFVDNFAEGSGWNPVFRATAAARLAGVEARVALYQNADPNDDPPLIGTGPGEACATCHRKR